MTLLLIHDGAKQIRLIYIFLLISKMCPKCNKGNILGYILDSRKDRRNSVVLFWYDVHVFKHFIMAFLLTHNRATPFNIFVNFHVSKMFQVSMSG